MKTFMEFLDTGRSATTFGYIFEREGRAVEKAPVTTSASATVEASRTRLTMAHAFTNERKDQPSSPAQVAVPPVRVRNAVTFGDVFRKAGIRA